MRWQETDFGCSATREDAASAELLVAVFLGADTAVETVRDAVDLWSRSLPGADFILFDRLSSAEQLVPALCAAFADAGLPPSRRLLVILQGVAADGVAAALGLRHPVCAGIVAYGALSIALKDLPPAAAQIKVRLIGCRGAGCGDEDRFAQSVRDFGAFGADVRGTLMLEAGLSPAAVRRGATYLAELSASALAASRHQGGGRLGYGRSPVIDRNTAPSLQ